LPGLLEPSEIGRFDRDQSLVVRIRVAMLLVVPNSRTDPYLTFAPGFPDL
jgi:hypothetical protein